MKLADVMNIDTVETLAVQKDGWIKFNEDNKKKIVKYLLENPWVLNKEAKEIKSANGKYFFVIF